MKFLSSAERLLSVLVPMMSPRLCDRISIPAFIIITEIATPSIPYMLTENAILIPAATRVDKDTNASMIASVPEAINASE